MAIFCQVPSDLCYKHYAETFTLAQTACILSAVSLATVLTAALHIMFQVEQKEYQRAADRGDLVPFIQMQLLQDLHDSRQHNVPLHMM